MFTSVCSSTVLVRCRRARRIRVDVLHVEKILVEALNLNDCSRLIYGSLRDRDEKGHTHPYAGDDDDGFLAALYIRQYSSSPPEGTSPFDGELNTSSLWKLGGGTSGLCGPCG